MSFLSPIAALIAAGLVIPALVALYFLKKRRRQVPISSTMLWKRTLYEIEVHSPFQRLRKSLLLLLQLLVLAALLFALARPTMQDVAEPGQRVLIVIDRSASMAAHDGPNQQTRLARAKDYALSLIDDLEGDAMVVSFAQQAQVVQAATSDRSRLRAAVRSITQTDQLSRIDEVVQLIDRLAGPGVGAGAAAAGGDMRVYLLSDGRYQSAGDLELAGAQVRFVRLGADPDAIDNVGIVALAARRSPLDPREVRVLARLANSGQMPVNTTLTLSVEGQVARVLPVTVPGAAGLEGEPGVFAAEFDLEIADQALIRVTHDHQDQLQADNRAYIMLAAAQQLDVLLVAPGQSFFRHAIGAAGVRTLVQMSPQAYEAQDPISLREGGWETGDGVAALHGRLDDARSSGFEVMVFDGYAPQQVPAVNSLFLGAAPPIEGLARVGPSEGAVASGLLDWRRDHPLLRSVALDNLVVADAHRLVLPTGPDLAAQPLAISADGPILAHLQADSRHYIVAAFDLVRTNWPLQESFPVFVYNALQWLGLGGQYEASLSFRPGDVAVVSTDGQIEQAVYEGPMRLTAPVRQGTAVLPMFEQAGIYNSRAGVAPPWDTLAVNLTDLTESDIRPVDRLDIAGAEPVEATQEVKVRREIWRWFILAALGFLVVEWLVYVRRIHV